ncbi:MAG: ThiF family adenylyltransferase [Candidatus Thorarchaeota archaeon]|jgi:molybdopterin/thiamine biosynthesis adenylyltransferase
MSKYSERVDRQVGLVYQERIEDMRVFIGGSGPVIDFLVTHLAFLGFGTSQGFIGFLKSRKVKEEDVKGQLLLDDSDLGRPLWEAIRDHVQNEIAPDIHVIGIDDLDAHSYDAVVATRSANSDPEDELILPQASAPIWAVCTKTAAYMGTEKPVYEQAQFDILTPSLAAVAAGFAVTEIMRRNQLIRPSEILSREINLRFVIQQRDILKKVRESQKKREGLPFKTRLTIGGEPLPAQVDEFTETITRYVGGKAEETVRVDPDRVILTVQFPRGSYMTRMLTSQVEVLDDIPPDMFKPTTSLLFSPLSETKEEHRDGNIYIIEKDEYVPTELKDKTVFFLGVGGIGSWSTALFNLSNTSNCTLILNDHDAEVEEHNLNRQILFTKDSIGKPKALAARKRLLEINPENKIISLPWQTEIGTANSIHMKDMLSLEEFERRKKESEGKTQVIDGIELPMDIVREESVLAYKLAQSDLLICGPDNIRTRYISTLIGKQLDIPVISAGAERFEGKVDLFDTNGDCYVCRYGEETKEQREVVSCTGKIPIPSIVSTIGTIGAMQTAIALSRLAELDVEVTHFVQYYPRYQMLAKCESGKGCRHKKQDKCPQHLNLPPEESSFVFFPPDLSEKK